MNQDSFIATIYGERKRVTRVSRITAKKMYEMGFRVWLQPRLLPFDHVLIRPMPMSKDDNLGSFESRTVEFMRTRCSRDWGTYPRYYVED